MSGKNYRPEGAPGKYWKTNMLRLSVTLVIWIACLAGPSCIDAADAVVNLAADWGELRIVAGLSRPYYWPSGNNGKNAELMAQGKFQGRKYMTEHPGDWCVALLKPKDGARVIFDSTTSVSLTLANQSTVRSECILAVDTPLEMRVWSTDDRLLLFEAGGTSYAQSLKWPGAYVLYVRFPDGLCLSSKGDERIREFKTKPIAVSVKCVKEVRRDEEGTP